MSMKSVLSCFLVDAISMKTRRMAIMAFAILISSVYMKYFSFICLIGLFQSLFFNEENGVSASFFAPASKKSAVLGRYAFSVFLLLLCVAINLIADLITPLFLAGYNHGDVLVYVLMSVAILVLISIETPFFYWLGYRNFRLINFPILIGGFTLFGRFIGENNLYSFIIALFKSTSLVLLFFASSFVSVLCSLAASVKIYSSKDI